LSVQALPRGQAKPDEIGALATIGEKERVAAASSVRKGQAFTLGLPIFDPAGGPVSPNQIAPVHLRYHDWGDYLAGHRDAENGMASVHDGFLLPCHALTHVDALGHIIIQGKLWGGHSAMEAVGGLRWASVLGLAEQGVFARAILVDIPRYLGVKQLARDQHVTFAQLQGAMQSQAVTPSKGDVLLLRTGSLGRYYEIGREAFFADYSEPGLSYEPELVAWFRDCQISSLGTDTLSNELPHSPTTNTDYPLHRYLLHELGVIFHEGLWLDEASDACATDGRWDGLFVCLPLKLTGGSGSPVNPLFVR
jgi:kynurenine formamidase